MILLLEMMVGAVRIGLFLAAMVTALGMLMYGSMVMFYLGNSLRPSLGSDGRNYERMEALDSFLGMAVFALITAVLLYTRFKLGLL